MFVAMRTLGDRTVVHADDLSIRGVKQRKIRVGTAAISLLLSFAFVASAQATITSSNVTTPADGSLLLQNLAHQPDPDVHRVRHDRRDHR